MKREAVQEERQRGAKMLPKQTDDVSQTNPVRDLTIERLVEAEQKSEARGGDNAIPYLRVGPTSQVQAEYKVISILRILCSDILHWTLTETRFTSVQSAPYPYRMEIIFIFRRKEVKWVDSVWELDDMSV